MYAISRKGLIVSAVSLLALTGIAACAKNDSMMSMQAQPADSNGVVTAAADGPAADLRSALDSLLGEHVQLAADATNAALNGREAEFNAAAAALDANSVDISNAVASVYGRDAGDAFLGLWRSHITMVVDYTVGTASKDKAAQDKAVGELIQYTQDFGAFINAANPNLPQEAVADLVKHHAITLKEVIDAQAAGDQERAYKALRVAYNHMASIAEALAQGIAKQFPEKFA
jgi:hypothetical protein